MPFFREVYNFKVHSPTFSNRINPASVSQQFILCVCVCVFFILLILFVKCFFIYVFERHRFYVDLSYMVVAMMTSANTYMLGIIPSHMKKYWMIWGHTPLPSPPNLSTLFSDH